jgi:hypothetical protein
MCRVTRIHPTSSGIRRQALALCLVSSALVAVVACSSDPYPGGPGPSPDGGANGTADGSRGGNGVAVSAECQAFARSLCSWAPRCEPDAFHAVALEADDCEARMALHCARIEAAPGAAKFPPSCVSELDARTCTGNLDQLPPSCWVRGALADGAACEFDEQCQSGWCSLTVQDNAIGPCGTCQARAKENESCQEADCELGLVCVGVEPTCRKTAGKDEPCHGSTGCAAPYQCFGDVCVEPQGENAPCKVSFLTGAQTCDTTKGLYCIPSDPLGEDGTCKRSRTVNLGETCVDDEDGEEILCRRGTCTMKTRQCTTLAEDGAACDAIFGPHCQIPAECMDGVCVIPLATRCE